MLGALALVPLGVQPSQATFVASSTTAASTFATAADFNTVAVTLDDPGTPLQGGVALAATASSDRGIERVRFQVSPAGAGTWADACEATAAPYTCAWDTNGDDGLVDVRAVARDTAGYERIAIRTGRRVDNTAPSVSLADPGASLKGSVTLSVTASDAGTGLAANSVIVEYRPSAGGAWTEICHRSATGTCAWATAGGAVPDGDYDLRARAADTLGHTAVTATLAGRHVDNSLPTASIPSPAAARHRRHGDDDGDRHGHRRQRRPEGRLRGAPDRHAGLVRRSASGPPRRTPARPTRPATRPTATTRSAPSPTTTPATRRRRRSCRCGSTTRCRPAPS